MRWEDFAVANPANLAGNELELTDASKMSWESITTAPNPNAGRPWLPATEAASCIAPVLRRKYKLRVPNDDEAFRRSQSSHLTDAEYQAFQQELALDTVLFYTKRGQHEKARDELNYAITPPQDGKAN